MMSAKMKKCKEHGVRFCILCYPRTIIDDAPDKNCITTADGGCIGGLMAGKERCMHDPIEEISFPAPQDYICPVHNIKVIGRCDMCSRNSIGNR